ncbi:hypothetical protein K438DRAFT_863745 [Mycena galopus ATCC 62051]|nr:hypothetical protein K438DRAFT_863745 [Mycena galopus ATCC 62051]
MLGADPRRVPLKTFNTILQSGLVAFVLPAVILATRLWITLPSGLGLFHEDFINFLFHLRVHSDYHHFRAQGLSRRDSLRQERATPRANSNQSQKPIQNPFTIPTQPLLCVLP